MKKSHILIMLLCCLVPILGLAAVTIFKLPLSNVLFWGMVLICPISMFFMMKSMFQDHNPGAPKAGTPSCHSETIDVVVKEK
jgi:uncharacterized membrane protein